MPTLNDLFRELALVELSNLSVTDEEVTDTILPEKRPKIVVAANDVLLALHSRFVLKEQDMLIEMREGVTNYHMLKRYAWSQFDADNPPDRFDMPYIMDSAVEPFREDVIKVLSVTNSFGDSMPLNDHEHPMSVFSPMSTLIQVPFPIPGQALAIEYQAKHPKLDHCKCDDEILLPDFLWLALKVGIAAKVYSNMNTQENTVKGQEHQMNYEALCQDAVEKDLVNTSSSTTNSRFEKRGFV